ncbi:MAG: hypothetical protein ACPGSD_07655 [Flavobacteriales bacterium]
MTIKDHYNQIIALKDGNSELSELAPYNDNGANLMNELNSGSKVAVWRLWVWIIATLTWLQNEALKKHKKEINAQIENQTHGTLIFYHNRSLNFQFGHNLEYNGKQYVYEVVDEASKIIKRCSVSMRNGTMRFKVTKENGGNLEPLTSSEQLAFKNYLLDILYPGTQYSVISTEADALKLNIKVYVNAQVIDPNTGEHLITGEPLVEDSINNYCKNLPFDGKLTLQKLIDHIQATEGVEDLELIEIAYQYGVVPWTVFTREIEPFSGYLELDVGNSNIEYYEYV